jgi:hypothetical protein
MHQQEQHKTEVESDMHEPSQEILPQYLYLQNYIEHKDPQERQDFPTEQGRDCSFDGSSSPIKGRYRRSFGANSVTEPGRDLQEQTNPKDCQRKV